MYVLLKTKNYNLYAVWPDRIFFKKNNLLESRFSSFCVDSVTFQDSISGKLISCVGENPKQPHLDPILTTTFKKAGTPNV